MGSLVAAMASSHAFALEDPQGWDEKRQRNRRDYARRYGALPEESAAVAAESDADIAARYGRLRHGFAHLRGRLAELRPDALVVVADDQDECFVEGNYPQLAIYTGGDFVARDVDRSTPRHRRRSDRQLARGILEACVDAGFDMAVLSTLPDDDLAAHAVGPVLATVDPGGEIPVVPLFVNAIHTPAPSPMRCHALGRAIRDAVTQSGRRVAVYGSGGLSHFPASFPPLHNDGATPFPWGSVDEEFDRWVVARIAMGEGATLARLSSADLHQHGEAELRSWLVVLGAVGRRRPQLIVYEAFARGIMGMGIAYWDLEKRQ